MSLDLLVLNPGDAEQAAFEAITAPNKVARGREGDRFFVLTRQHGGQVLSQPDLHRWLQRLCLRFFDQSGSVTRALQAVIDQANDDALVQNLNQPNPMHPYALDLLAGVLHYDALLLVQAGNLAMAAARKGFWQQHSDPSLALRPLGLSAAPKSVLFQVPLSGNDLLALGHSLPEMGSTLDPQPIFDWLDAGTQEDPRVLLQVREGESKVRHLPRTIVRSLWQQDAELSTPTEEAQNQSSTALRPEEKFELAQTQAESPSTELSMEIGTPAPEDTTDSFRTELERGAEQQAQKPDLGYAAAPSPLESDLLTQEQRETLASPEHLGSQLPAQYSTEANSINSQMSLGSFTEIADAGQIDDLQTQRKLQREMARKAEQSQRLAAQKERLEKLKKTALRGLAGGAGFLNKLGTKANLELDKQSANDNGFLKKPVALLTKILLAILIPLVIIVAAGGIYLARGRGAQFNEYLHLAQESARGAALMKTEEERLSAWTQVLAYLNRAEALDRNEESAALRKEAEQALDHLDNANPIQFSQIPLPFGSGKVEITHLAAYNVDLFALDKSTGSVLHFSQKDKGYTFDPGFTCEPGNYEGGEVGPLVAMTSIPINNSYRALILAVDAQGRALYCGVGRSPQAALLPPPETGWGSMATVLYDSGRLLILDREKARLWVYDGAVDALMNPPRSYFEGHDFDLTGAVDMAVSGNEAFIVYEDGISAHCISSPINASLECEKPAQYTDERPNLPKQDFDLAKFSRLAFAPPPEAAVYYLDSHTGRLYQFSQRLNLNTILRPAAGTFGLPLQPVTAFLVTPNRQVFYAYGSQLFYAYLP